MNSIEKLKKPQLILWCEDIGFLAIIFLSWANEFLDLPRHIFGGVTQVNWRESAMETILALIVWLSVHVVTRRVLARLYYLEEFLRLCAWCRKVAHDDEWLSLEEYFNRGFNIKTSHGMCPDCAKELMAAGPDSKSKLPH
jgi:hypothetical protein